MSPFPYWLTEVTDTIVLWRWPWTLMWPTVPSLLLLPAFNPPIPPRPASSGRGFHGNRRATRLASGPASVWMREWWRSASQGSVDQWSRDVREGNYPGIMNVWKWKSLHVNTEAQENLCLVLEFSSLNRLLHLFICSYVTRKVSAELASQGTECQMFILSLKEVQGNVKVKLGLESGDFVVPIFVCHLIQFILLT